MGTTLFVDGDYSREKAFFESFPLHPIEPGKLVDLGLQTVEYTGKTIRVDSFQQVDGMNLESLCDRIVRDAIIPGNVMVICHGSENGLTLPIVKGGTSCQIGAEAVKMLLSSRTSEAAYYFNMSTSQGNVIERVQEKLRAVHRKQLNHLAIRACSVGQNAQNLEQLIRLFGAKSGSALKMRVFCAKIVRIKVTSDQRVFSNSGWKVYNERPFRIAFLTSGGEVGNIHFDFVETAVESPEAVDQFVDNYLPTAVRRIKETAVIGGKKIAVTRVEKFDYVLTPKTTVPCYFTYDGFRMHFVKGGKFSDSLVYRTHPSPGSDPFAR